MVAAAWSLLAKHPPAVASLPLGLPWLGAHFRLDALTAFFLLVVNVVYSFFETFGVIHTITSGGPQQATTILVYKVFSDGFVGQDLGSSAAQSVILLILVGALTVLQFRFVERRVHY